MTATLQIGTYCVLSTRFHFWNIVLPETVSKLTWLPMMSQFKKSGLMDWAIGPSEIGYSSHKNRFPVFQLSTMSQFRFHHLPVTVCQHNRRRTESYWLYFLRWNGCWFSYEVQVFSQNISLVWCRYEPEPSNCLEQNLRQSERCESDRNDRERR